MISRTHLFGLGCLWMATGCSENLISDINRPPDVSILSHSDGDFLSVGVETALLGDISDDDNPAADIQAMWVLNDMILCDFAPIEADGTTQCAVTGTEGVHNIQLLASDGDGGWGSDDVDLIARPTVCDGSPAWTDPFEDGSLRLFEEESYGFDSSEHSFSFACVQDEARINICDAETQLTVGENTATTIGGNGFTPLMGQDVDLHIESETSEPIFILLDSTESSFTISFNTPNAAVTLTSKGTHALSVGTVNSGPFTAAVGGDYIQAGPLTANGVLTVDAAGAIDVNAPITAGAEGQSNSMVAGSSISIPLDAPTCP